jgi:hypothetical protein
MSPSSDNRLTITVPSSYQLLLWTVLVGRWYVVDKGMVLSGGGEKTNGSN